MWDKGKMAPLALLSPDMLLNYNLSLSLSFPSIGRICNFPAVDNNIYLYLASIESSVAVEFESLAIAATVKPVRKKNKIQNDCRQLYYYCSRLGKAE